MNKRDKKRWYLPGHVTPEEMGLENHKHPLDDKGSAWRSEPPAPIGTATATTYKRCAHDGRTVIFTLDVRPLGTTLSFGGATGFALDYSCADLILDCGHVTSGEAKRFIKAGPPAWLALNQLVKPRAKIVRLDWPDQQAPLAVPLRFWHSAVRLMARELPKGGHVIITCTGGHGRTGTCLASILLAHSERSATNVIDYIRETHCQDAIETLAQEEYLERLAIQRGK